MLFKSNPLPKASEILRQDDPKAAADRELQIEIRLEDLKEKKAKEKIHKMQAVVDSLESDPSDSEFAAKVEKQNDSRTRQFKGKSYSCTRCKKGFYS